MAKKEVKKKKIKDPVNSQYVFDLCVEVYKDELDKADLGSRRNGLLAHERVIAQLEEKYQSRERAEKRFREWAQIYAPTVRAALKVMGRRGELPQAAEIK